MWGPTSSGATPTSRPSWRTNMSWSQPWSSSVSAWRCSFWACWDAVPQSQSPKSALAWCVWPVFEFLLLIIDYFVCVFVWFCKLLWNVRCLFVSFSRVCFFSPVPGRHPGALRWWSCCYDLLFHLPGQGESGTFIHVYQHAYSFVYLTFCPAAVLRCVFELHCVDSRSTVDLSHCS